MSPDCLNEATVLEFVEGTLPADRRPAIETHLASCGACADLVTSVAAEIHGTTRTLGRAARSRAGSIPAGTHVGRYQILNFDLTYDRTDGAYGPDEVGSHPQSQSPFDVDDLAGNIMEMVASNDAGGGLAIRGGAFYLSAASARSSNRLAIPRSFRDVNIGLRVCADAPAP